MNTCKICNAQFEKACSLGTHLWKTHGLKPQEYYDKYIKADGEGNCAECGGPTKFKTIGQGYLEFCSKRCSAKHIANDTVRNAHKTSALKATMLAVHGVDNAAHIESCKAKRKETMKRVYGVEYYSQYKDFAEKCHNTNMERYGATSYLGSSEGQSNIREHNMAAFGAPYRFCLRTNSAIPEYDGILSKYNCHVVTFTDKKHISFKCDNCGELFEEQDLYIKLRNSKGITPCPQCEPKNPHDSFEEHEVRDFITDDLGVECRHYDRDFLDRYGADIVCEEQKVIIEYDGLHWHVAANRGAEYHINKTKIAERMGYHLVHVFSDEWLNKRDIVKSRLANILHRNIPMDYVGNDGNVYNYMKINARDCEVCMVSDDESVKFLNSNHIQGYVPATYRYGLKYNGELVAMMTFGKSRFSGPEYELLRFCNRIYTNVVGGAAKLFAHYRADGGIVNNLISYADRRWSSKDAFYTKLGFRLVAETHIGYTYLVNGVRESRFNYQKHKLVADGADPNLTEEEIMAESGHYRVYDCGNYKYVYDEKAQD